MNDRDPRIEKALAELRAADAAVGPSPAVEARLRARPAARPKPRRLMPLLAVAAGLAIIVAASLLWRPAEPVAPRPPVAAQTGPVYAVTPFVALDYGRPDPAEITAGRLVRVSMPLSAPAELGIVLPPPAPGTREIEADVLLGEDGVAQAVRFMVPVSD